MNSLSLALVPENHLVRKLETYVDWSFIYNLCNPLYADKERKRVTDAMLLLFAAMNIKKMVSYLWKQGVESSEIEDTIEKFMNSFIFLEKFGYLIKKS